jgi:hypothetical protein
VVPVGFTAHAPREGEMKMVIGIRGKIKLSGKFLKTRVIFQVIY